MFNWDFVMEKVMDIFKDVFGEGKCVKEFNATLLVLASKKEGAKEQNNFNP